jgi:Flp pilus assembly pilin Flp
LRPSNDTASLRRYSLRVSTQFWKSRLPWIRAVYLAEKAQGLAEYAMIFAVILIIVIGTVRLIGTNTSQLFSTIGSVFQPDHSGGGGSGGGDSDH